ncbi:hypothetical protein GV829_04655 [Sphingomonas lacunae]|uniref:Uncharacterized protein n=1 Tax=Sphingomonas lacunae TaxID=2698828 RepID=A0A6M4ASZ1_9SPHN|nr:hypothetical protein [Sphingomonas lacunae]QJQ31826.1 hypothetical protein GV829_04655 [Sphingomonas lacunae]
MAQLAVPMMAAGGIVKAVGGVRAGLFNQAVAQTQADEALAIGNAEAMQVRDAARATMVNQLGSMAESGFAIGEGTALTVLEQSLLNREVDVMQARRNAAGKAAGLRAQGRMAMEQGLFGAAAELIGAAGAIGNYRADYAAARGPVAPRGSNQPGSSSGGRGGPSSGKGQ